MAAPTVNGTVGTAKCPGFGNANVTLNKPSGTAVGEILVAYITVYLGTAISKPTGWTQVYAIQNGNVYAGCYYRVVDGTEGSSFTWTNTSSTDRATGVIFRVGGADTTTPTDGSGTSSQTGDSAADTSPSVTTTVDQDLILVTHHSQRPPSTDTVPSGTTQIAFIDYTPDAVAAGTRLATTSKSPAGATGTYLWTITGFAADAILSSVAVAPSGGGSPPPPPAVSLLPLLGVG